jgi:nitroimidazol reductase NimA-like FMN-containing flavoprotein (pyridoxamine 5'-phosphate oxidase superfamily)
MQTPNEPAPGPRASRARIPPEYGVPKHDKGLLPWAHVIERMQAATVYWVCAVGPTGRPHATPVDGLWLDDTLYFGGSPAARRQRYLRANPAVSVHLESGHEVVILNGDARESPGLPRELAERLSAASKAKYGYGPAPRDYMAPGRVFVFRPREVFA